MKHKYNMQKILFFCTVFLAFLAIFIYNTLTPLMADDLPYAEIVANASSFSDIIKQEYTQYMTWSGRSVVHLLVRIFLSQGKWVFNIFNSFAFVGLTLLMYRNLAGRKEYDMPLYLFINVMVWTFSISFAQTVLWETGACNYLWGTVIILGFVTLYRELLQKESAVKSTNTTKNIGIAIGMFLFGVLAGWCNENTSGGGILLVLILLICFIIYHKRGQLWMYSGLGGMVLGFLMMVTAPGNKLRAAGMAIEEQGFLMKLIERFLKCTIVIKDNFMVLLIMFIILFIFVLSQTKEVKRLFTPVVYFVAFLATSYALVLSPEQQPRAFFGAGIFLMIAIASCFDAGDSQNEIFMVVKRSLVAVLLLTTSFMYITEGANLARVYREMNERTVLLETYRDDNSLEATIPMLSEEFETKFTMAYEVDVKEDPKDWINEAYRSYFGLEKVMGITREEWNNNEK